MSELKQIVDNIKNNNFDDALRLCQLYQSKKNKHILSNFKGVIYLLQGKNIEAEKNFLKSIEENQTFIDPINNLIKFYFQNKNFESLLTYAKKLFEIDKSNPSFNYKLAFALEQNYRFEESIKYYENCIKLNGEDKIKALNNIGVIYSKLNKKITSNKYLLEAFKINPNDKFVVNNLLSNFIELRDIKNSELFYKKAESLDTNLNYFLYNKAIFLILIGKINSAIEILIENKNEIKFFSKLIHTYLIIGEKDKAKELFNEFKKINAKDLDYYNFLGMRYLYDGDFENGWKYYEFRLTKSKNFLNHISEWKGENIRKKNIAVYNEQGLGDCIQFSKYLFPLLKYDCNITFLVPKNLIEIFNKDLPNLKILSEESIDTDENEKFDYKISLGSLIKFFYKNKLEENNLISKTKKPSTFKINKHKLNVGIAWSGSFNGTGEPFRSIPLKSLKKIFSLDVKYYSLQSEIWKRDTNEYNSLNMTNLGNYTLSELSTIIQSLDLVISSDTSILHLSASLNKETWGLLSLHPDWRWGAFYKLNPYNSLKLFHQKKFNIWDDVEKEIYENLKEKLIKKKNFYNK